MKVQIMSHSDLNLSWFSLNSGQKEIVRYTLMKQLSQISNVVFIHNQSLQDVDVIPEICHFFDDQRNDTYLMLFSLDAQSVSLEKTALKYSC